MTAIEALDIALRLLTVLRNDAEDNAIENPRFADEYKRYCEAVDKLREIRRRESQALRNTREGK